MRRLASAILYVKRGGIPQYRLQGQWSVLSVQCSLSLCCIAILAVKLDFAAAAMPLKARKRPKTVCLCSKQVVRRGAEKSERLHLRLRFHDLLRLDFGDEASLFELRNDGK